MTQVQVRTTTKRKAKPPPSPRRLAAADIELACSRYFTGSYIIVPNVSWGMGLLYEADLVVLRVSGYAAEVEIKTSAADIRRDLKKSHQHDSNFFKELWFAVPEALKDDPNIPKRAGILVVRLCWGKYPKVVAAARKAVRNPKAVKWSLEKQLKLCRLGMMRVWTLKETVRNHQLKDRK